MGNNNPCTCTFEEEVYDLDAVKHCPVTGVCSADGSDCHNCPCNKDGSFWEDIGGCPSCGDPECHGFHCLNYD